jgi:hypothetical protein
MKLAEFAWKLPRLGEGAAELARRAGLRPPPGEAIAVPAAVLAGTRADLDHWLDWVGTRLGLEIEPVDTMVSEIDRLLAAAGPAILAVDGEDGTVFLLLLGWRFGQPRLLAPDLHVRSCPAHVVRGWLTRTLEAPHTPAIDRLIDVAGIARRRRGHVRATLLEERLATQRIGGGWMLRLPAGASFSHQLAREGVPKRLAGMLVLFAALYGLEILAWIVVGAAAIDGRVDLGWLGAWGLLVASMIPLRLVGGWLRSTLSSTSADCSSRASSRARSASTSTG